MLDLCYKRDRFSLRPGVGLGVGYLVFLRTKLQRAQAPIFFIFIKNFFRFNNCTDFPGHGRHRCMFGAQITELMEAAIPALEAMLALRWLGVQSAAALGAGYVAAHVCPAVVAAFLAVSTTTASTAMALSSNSQAPSTPDPSAQRRRRSSTVDVLGRALGAGCALALAAAMCAPTGARNPKPETLNPKP